MSYPTSGPSGSATPDPRQVPPRGPNLVLHEAQLNALLELMSEALDAGVGPEQIAEIILRGIG